MTLATRIFTQDDRLVIGRSQDCTPILDDAVRRHNEGLHGTAEVKHAARIPNVIVEKYCNENGVTFADFMNDPVHIKRLVEHPDNSMFRIWKGKL
jgi:hypothetical protein